MHIFFTMLGVVLLMSEMVALLRAEGSRRMPPDFALPEVDIALIERWITDGANDD